jgi:hypothetical protein
VGRDQGVRELMRLRRVSNTVHSCDIDNQRTLRTGL